MEKYNTKFRAFQLDSEGSLFSYYKAGRYTLIEARLPKGGITVLREDIGVHQKTRIDLLHITSWDVDHCNYDDLVQILNNFRPEVIQVPAYLPETEEGKLCHNIIFKYDYIHSRYVNNVQPVTKEFLLSLPEAQSYSSGDVVYASEYDSEVKNDMSLIRLFRSDGFSVLSLGDCESESISERLQNYSILRGEVDVMILSHHGAENGLTSGELLDAVKPLLAVCSSNYDNKFDHPSDSIRSLLAAKGVPLLTTKRGDIIIVQEVGDDRAYAFNLISNNEKSEAPITFTPKRVRKGQQAA